MKSCYTALVVVAVVMLQVCSADDAPSSHPFMAWLVEREIIPAQTVFFTPKQDKDGIRAASKLDVSLPNVLIIGDSISIGYTKPVIVLMKGKANVQRAKANCGDTARGLSSLEKWLGDTRWDVIHFYWGLHDLCFRHPDSKEQGRRDKKNGTQAVSLEQYAKNLEAIVQEFRKLEPSSYGRQRPSCPEAK
jgi:hypothetical protein